MIIEAFCKKCNLWYDGHWLNYPKADQTKRVLTPKCPKCGVEGRENIQTFTDDERELDIDNPDEEEN